MIFKKGNYVEIINLIKDTYLLGSRFHIDKEYIGKGSKCEKGKLYYCLPTNLSTKSKEGFEVIDPKFLKIVNPDNDEQSEFTFNELMLDLTKSESLTHNTKG